MQSSPERARPGMDTDEDLHEAPQTLTPAPQVLDTHLAELARLSTWRDSLWRKARNSLPISFVNYVVRSFGSYFRSLILAPSTVLFDPLSTLATIIIYPVIFTVLAAVVVVFYVGSLLGGRYILRAINNKYANGYSIINWPNPDLFSSDHAYKTVESARTTLGGCATTFPDAPAPGEVNVDMEPGLTTRIFDLDVAKAFLIMSALVYERVDGWVDVAARIVDTDREKAEKYVMESERVIREQAGKWNLRYEGISDLASAAGPFASVFYTQEDDPHPFIVLCFKGTTPTDFAEFLVDATISRISSAVFFGDGTAHQGFYTDLFPTTQGGADGYGQITRSLKHIAKGMVGGGKGKVNLWVTGHSLGSALASLVFARYLRMPEDLGDDIKLRDAYTYGTPRIGDGIFASKYEESTCNPIDRPNILWRITNHWDIVCQIPPGLGDNELNRSALPPSSVLNYAHIGASTTLTPWKYPYYSVQASEFHAGTRVVVVKDGPQGVKRSGSWWSWGVGARWGAISGATKAPLRWVLMMLPTPIWNHFPASYYTHLSQIHVDGQGGEERRREKRSGAGKKREVVVPSVKGKEGLKG